MCLHSLHAERIFVYLFLFHFKVLKIIILTLSSLLTTIVLYANSLDTDETPSNSASQPDLNRLTLTHLPTFSDLEVKFFEKEGLH